MKTSDLMGNWVSDPHDEASIREYGSVSLEFSDDGRLFYTIHSEGKRRSCCSTTRLMGMC
jgi:hypothetical protein